MFLLDPIATVDLEPFRAAAEIAKTLVTASAAMLALSITFARDNIPQDPIRTSQRVLWFSWAMFLASVVTGLLLLMNLAGRIQVVVAMTPEQLAAARNAGPHGGEAGIYHGTLRCFAFTQIGLFVLAVLALGLSGILTYRTRVELERKAHAAKRRAGLGED